MSSPVSSHAVANKFLELAEEKGEKLTNMQLQKLVFIAQGFTLALKNRPLFYHEARAWQWGPVIPELYESLQRYGRNYVEHRLETERGDVIHPNSAEDEIIRAVWEGYGHMSGTALSKLTHKPGTPWSKTWEKEPFAIIDPRLIGQHYRRIIQAA